MGAVFVGVSKKEGSMPFADFYVPGVVLMSVNSGLILIIIVAGGCLFVCVAGGLPGG
jgi:hypothetical protein